MVLCNVRNFKCANSGGELALPLLIPVLRNSESVSDLPCKVRSDWIKPLAWDHQEFTQRDVNHAVGLSLGQFASSSCVVTVPRAVASEAAISKGFMIGCSVLPERVFAFWRKTVRVLGGCVRIAQSPQSKARASMPSSVLLNAGV